MLSVEFATASHPTPIVRILTQFTLLDKMCCKRDGQSVRDKYLVQLRVKEAVQSLLSTEAILVMNPLVLPLEYRLCLL